MTCKTRRGRSSVQFGCTPPVAPVVTSMEGDMIYDAPSPSTRVRSLTAVLAAILLLLLACAHVASANVRPQSVDFESSGFSSFDQLNASVGTLSTVDGGYGDAHAAKATYSGGGDNGFARGIFNVDWNSGDDVWYSAAYRLPRGFKKAMQGQVALMRWDDYGSHPNSANYSGIVIYGGDKRARLVEDRIASSTQIELSHAFDLPEGRWFHLEVHQHLTATGDGGNDVYIDGQKVSSSNEPNLQRGRSGADRIRYGMVAIASGAQTHPLSLEFDNPTVSTHRVGPDPSAGDSAPSSGGTVTAARYTPRVRKCMRRALARAARSGDAGKLPKAARRCVKKYAIRIKR
jgi:hypothetical protein